MSRPPHALSPLMLTLPRGDLLPVAQTCVHYGLHLLAPGLIAWFAFRDRWRRAWCLMLATMLVDLDHLFAYPAVFVPDRCGIQFHPLHTYWAMGLYVLLTLAPKTRIVGVGLLLHMLTDAQDCAWMSWLARAGAR